MACDLRCPNCQDNLGKDTENDRNAYCGNCGERFNNPRGAEAQPPQRVRMTRPTSTGMPREDET